jgi:hypothetical protein
MRKTKTRVPVTKYKGQQIYFDLDDNRFKVDDKLTGQTFEAAFIWDIYTKIDNPIYEAAEEVGAYHVSVLDAYPVNSVKKNARTGTRVFERLDNKLLASGGIFIEKNEESDRLYAEYADAHKIYNHSFYVQSAAHDKLKQAKKI